MANLGLRFLRENAPSSFLGPSELGNRGEGWFNRSINPILAEEKIFLVSPLDFRFTYGPVSSPGTIYNGSRDF